MISLSDLKAKRAAMTQGKWLEPEGNRLRGAIDAVVGGVRRQVAQASSEAPAAEDDLDCGPNDVAGPRLLANATGIVATHNAADVLIEIAEAALDRAYAECSCGAELGCFPDCTREIAGQRLLAALAKIKP